jgi:hypothetical protein
VLPPGFTVCEPGVADTVKFGDVTVNVTVVVCVRDPLVPVIVSVKLPVGVLAAVVTVSVELPPALTDVGLNVPVALVGKPLTLKLTVPLNPFWALVLTV